MTEKLASIKNNVLYIVIFASTVLLAALSSFFYGKEPEEIIRIVVVMTLCAGILVFLLIDNTVSDGFKGDNKDKQWRFCASYLGTLILAVSVPLISNQAWPYMAMMVLLALFSNGFIGIVSGSFLILLSVLLEESGSYTEFFIYFISGCLAIVLLDHLQDTQDVGFPIFIALLMQFVLFVAFDILFQNKTFTVISLIVPIVCTFIDAIILFITLGAYSLYIIRGSTDMYMDINDTEFSLLVEIKEKDKDEYYKAIHTAYLTERAAIVLGLNNRPAKTCAYYKRVGVLCDSNKWEDVEHYFIENNFPEETLPYLKEFFDEQSINGFVRRETTVVDICEELVISIMYLIRKNNNPVIDYDALIDKIIDNMLDKKLFNRSSISFSDLEKLRKLLKKEKLYYDFLR
ncbi:MAG: hypothetical protein K6A23_02510 [Butyrivibrio sp.]|nr:hypothetical protein [Butyrivibrio sp.]